MLYYQQNKTTRLYKKAKMPGIFIVVYNNITVNKLMQFNLKLNRRSNKEKDIYLRHNIIQSLPIAFLRNDWNTSVAIKNRLSITLFLPEF